MRGKRIQDVTSGLPFYPGAAELATYIKDAVQTGYIPRKDLKVIAKALNWEPGDTKGKRFLKEYLLVNLWGL